MKLDFLKSGLVNTANFIPTYAIGEINMHPIALFVNALGRLLSIYLCFQFNEELDVKSIILAILFPALYIMYIMADKGIDDVLDKFDLEVTDFTEIFDSDSEKCVERKGKDGDLKSVPEDKKSCENVIGGRPNSKMECESIMESLSPISGDRQQRNDAGVCKYTGGGDTMRCGDIKYPAACNASNYGCSWNNYDLTEDESRIFCEEYSQRTDVSLSECPAVCPYYLKGDPNFKVGKGANLHHIYLSVPVISTDAAVNPAHLNGDTTGETYVWPISAVGTIADNPEAGTAEAAVASGTLINQPARSSQTNFPIHYNWAADSYNQFNKSAYIVVEFDAAASGNSFYPIFNTDYRGESITLHFLDDRGSVRRSLSGKVVTILPSVAGVTTLTTLATSVASINHVFSKPVKIANTEGGRRSGTYRVVIQPELKEFYSTNIKTSAAATGGGDAMKNIYGINDIESYEIQAVINSNENDEAHCGKVWGDNKATGENDPGVLHSISATASPGYIADMKLRHKYWKTHINDRAEFRLADASFPGQFNGSCQ